ncbi:hypothetical protein I546_3106 [Mycobacterium kansasii 732]|nr:hypothetical protein I546_3106 [Mycobacterium kansasii 732]
MADDFGFGDEELDDEEEPGATGSAALMCRSETLGVRFAFYPTSDDALAAARTCHRPDCVGDHLVAARDDRGAIRTVPALGRDAADIPDLLAQLRASRVENRRDRWRGRKQQQRQTQEDDHE